MNRFVFTLLIFVFSSNSFSGEYRQDFWKRWFDNNKSNYTQTEINNFYDYYTQTKYQYINGNDTLKFLEYVKQVNNDNVYRKAKQTQRNKWTDFISKNAYLFSQEELNTLFWADSIDSNKIMRVYNEKNLKHLFWTRWFENNKRKYNQETINLIYDGFKQANDTIEFLKYVVGIDSIHEVYRQAGILDSINYQKFLSKNKLVLKKFKHITDKFSQFEFWEYSNIFSSGNYSIDLIATENRTQFYVRNSSRGCFDDDASIVLLLKNGKTVRFFSISDFNCDNSFATKDLEDGEIDSPVISIRINHGSHARGLYDFNTNKQQSSQVADILKNVYYTNKAIVK